MRINGRAIGRMSFLAMMFLTMVSICLVGVAADASTLYFAQMADGGGYVTQIVLANPGDADVTATLELFKSDGSPLTVTFNGATDKSFTWKVKSLGSLFIKSSGTGSEAKTGWVRVKSTRPLGGSLVYAYMAGSKATSEAGLDPSAPVTQFFFTVDTRQNNYSGLAVANPNDTAIDIRYLLYDVDGKLKSKVSQNLNGFNHSAKLIGEIFSDQNLTDFTGIVTAFSSGGSMVATTLRFDTAVGTLASIPVTTGLVIACDSKAGDLYGVDNIVGNLRYVPAGTFIQGSPSTEAGRFGDEGPQFQHTLTKNMAVMETEVTRQMWADLWAAQGTLPADPTNTSIGSGMNNPVQRVTWYETVLFANLLSLQSGLTRAYYADAGFSTPITPDNFETDSVYVNWNADGYRLPTEGEWEYFTRAGTTTPFSIDEPAYNTSPSWSCAAGTLAALESVAWFCSNAGSGTHPVGSKAANPWGLKDVHGNVSEWCWDRWIDYYPGLGQTNYQGPSSGSDRVFRGGSWILIPRYLRSAFRSSGYPGDRSSYNPGNGDYGGGIGFRLLRSVN